MAHPIIHLLAVTALLVQALLGPAVPGRGAGVVLCLSFGGCGVERTAVASCNPTPACCAGCRPATCASDSGDNGLRGLVVALRTACGDGCSDCLDLEPPDDLTVASARSVTIPAPTATATVGISVVALTTTEQLGRGGLPAATGPPREPAHAPMVRAVRLRL